MVLKYSLIKSSIVLSGSKPRSLIGFGSDKTCAASLLNSFKNEPLETRHNTFIHKDHIENTNKIYCHPG